MIFFGRGKVDTNRGSNWVLNKNTKHNNKIPTDVCFRPFFCLLPFDGLLLFGNHTVCFRSLVFSIFFRVVCSFLKVGSGAWKRHRLRAFNNNNLKGSEYCILILYGDLYLYTVYAYEMHLGFLFLVLSYCSEVFIVLHHN